jgi:hypothetical protein
MKTPENQKRWAREWKARKVAEGWKNWTILAPAGLIQKVKAYYHKTKKEFGL